MNAPPTADLVSRLRENLTLEYDKVDDLMMEAAAELERMRAALRVIAHGQDSSDYGQWQATANRLSEIARGTFDVSPTQTKGE